VWISFAIGEGMMLPVTGNPLLRHDSRRQPEPQTHWQLRQVVELHTAMRLRAMKKQRNTDVGYVAGNDDEKNWFPPISRPASEIGHYLQLRFCAYKAYGRNLSGAE